MKTITIDESKIVSFKTEARAEGKNRLLKVKHRGMNLICERPDYFLKGFELDLFVSPFDIDGKIIYGKDIEIYFDQKGRWWCPEELSSEYLVNFFIKNPLNYFGIMSRKLHDTKKVIKTLKQINKKLGSLKSADLIDNLNKLKDCYHLFYSYYSPTYIVYDDLVLRFRQLLRKFLPVKEANVYFCEFLQAEITKEAIKHNVVGENTVKNRTPTTAKDKVVIFYKEPKLFHRSNLDNKVLERLYTDDLANEFREEFLALRLIVPIAIQISEEAQYIECKMLWPITALLLENINKYLIDRNKIESTEDIKNYSIHKLISLLDQDIKSKNRIIAKGLGVSQGKALGRVNIITNMDEHSKFKEGDILVTRMTNPGMVMLMEKAAAIICDIGGMTSHSAILSREMGIPCIVAARCVKTGKSATEVLEDGMLIEICGKSGECHLMNEEEGN